MVLSAPTSGDSLPYAVASQNLLRALRHASAVNRRARSTAAAADTSAVSRLSTPCKVIVEEVADSSAALCQLDVQFSKVEAQSHAAAVPSQLVSPLSTVTEYSGHVARAARETAKHSEVPQAAAPQLVSGAMLSKGVAIPHPHSAEEP